MHVSSCRLRGAVRRACGMTAAYNAMPLPVLRHGSTSRDRRVPSDAPPAGNANHAEANDAEHRKRRRDLNSFIGNSGIGTCGIGTSTFDGVGSSASTASAGGESTTWSRMVRLTIMHAPLSTITAWRARAACT